MSLQNVYLELSLYFQYLGEFLFSSWEILFKVNIETPYQRPDISLQCLYC